MRPIFNRLRLFFIPPPETPLWLRLLPYLVLGMLTILVLVGGAYAWDYTNSPEFCGATCHTMPPEYTAYLVSPHARVDCVDCHIGRGFIATRITRKAGDAKHIISLAFEDYEFPIRAQELRPARDTCEKCHFPEKFSDDSLRVIRHYQGDLENTPLTYYLTLKTGGGTKRQGLGRGIHWHIENPVMYLPADASEQAIPYVQVLQEDGSVMEFTELGSDFDPSSIDPSQLEEMDCITCHNRITHLILQPEDSLDQLMSRGVISPAIPEIRRKALEVLTRQYLSKQSALQAIGGLTGYYTAAYPDFYQANSDLLDQALLALKDYYSQSVFPEQKADWKSHPDNTGHKFSPGCFRCHDGKHLNPDGEAIRLECNLCHSIPIEVAPADLVAQIEISLGPEPETHFNPNWIALHREVFDPTCASCHTTDDPGGISNTSFCSNSACHGLAWEYAGFDAPGLREILLQQLPPTPIPPSPEGEPPTFTSTIAPILQAKCSSCHAESGMMGLNLTTYETVLQGGDSGPALVPGDPEASLLVSKMAGEQPHFGQLTPQELTWVVQWIENGAPLE